MFKTKNVQYHNTTIYYILVWWFTVNCFGEICSDFIGMHFLLINKKSLILLAVNILQVCTVNMDTGPNLHTKYLKFFPFEVMAFVALSNSFTYSEH